MASISRSSVLYTIVAVILVAALPGAIWRLIHTGDPYLFTERFYVDIVARLSGPGRMRFILQPAMAIILGARSGVKDARAGFAPFLWTLAFHGAHRRELLLNALASIRDLMAVAILLDVVSQLIIFREVHPAAALLLAPILIGTPYALSRALTNRIMRWRGHNVPSARIS